MILVSQDLNELILAIRDRKDHLAKSYDCLESLEQELQEVAKLLAQADAVLEDSTPKDVACVNVSADLTTLSKLSEELFSETEN